MLFEKWKVSLDGPHVIVIELKDTQTPIKTQPLVYYLDRPDHDHIAVYDNRGWITQLQRQSNTEQLTTLKTMLPYFNFDRPLFIDSIHKSWSFKNQWRSFILRQTFDFLREYQNKLMAKHYQEIQNAFTIFFNSLVGFQSFILFTVTRFEHKQFIGFRPEMDRHFCRALNITSKKYNLFMRSNLYLYLIDMLHEPRHFINYTIRKVSKGDTDIIMFEPTI